MVGVSFAKIFTKEDLDCGTPDRVLRQASATGTWDDVGWRVGGSGARFWAATSVTLVRTPNGVPIGHMVVTRDLTAFEDARTATLDQSTARLVSLGRVAAAMSHDLSNILTAIRGFAGLLERDLPTSGGSHQVWHELIKACDRGADLASRTLGVGSAAEDASASVDLSTSLPDMHALLAHLLPSGITLTISVDHDLPPVRACRASFELAVMNLVVNARDAIDRRGTITISAAREQEGEAGRSGRIVVTVQDTGAGMSPAMQERVFERFFTTKHADGGTGLGLSIVREAVRAMGGSVEIESRAGRGTRVRILLATVDPECGADVAYPAVGRRRLGPRVLVCCASEVLRGCVAEFLTRERFSLLPVGDGAAAERAWADVDGDVAATIIDLKMAGSTTGPGLMTTLRAGDAGPGAIFLADSASDAAELLDSLGPRDRVLMSPFSPEQLREAVREVLVGEAHLGTALIN